MTKSKVLITGASGFIGSHLAKELLERGKQVKVLIRSTSDCPSLRQLDLDIIEGDLSNESLLSDLLWGCSEVYHAAAYRGKSKNLHYQINVEATEKLALAALSANTRRFVFCSTAGIYGTVYHSPVNERTKPNPNTHYRRTKMIAEQTLLRLHRLEKLPIVIARLSSIYGPGGLNFAGLVKDLSKKNFRMIGSGENLIHLGYVSDAVQGLIRCGEVDNIEGNFYLLSGGEAIKVKEFIRTLCQELGRSQDVKSIPDLPYKALNKLSNQTYKYLGLPIQLSHRHEMFLANKSLDISKAKTELNYQPIVPISQGIKQLVGWYRKMKLI